MSVENPNAGEVLVDAKGKDRCRVVAIDRDQVQLRMLDSDGDARGVSWTMSLAALASPAIGWRRP